MSEIRNDKFMHWLINNWWPPIHLTTATLFWLLLTPTASAESPEQISQLQGALIAVGTALLGFIGAWLNQRTQRISVEKRLKGPFIEKLPETYEVKSCRLLILGDGGAGKTALIRALTGNIIADSNVKTLDGQVYKMRFDSSEPPPAYTVLLEARDYRGQKSRRPRIGSQK